jgi:hypothetical protein
MLAQDPVDRLASAADNRTSAYEVSSAGETDGPRSRKSIFAQETEPFLGI